MEKLGADADRVQVLMITVDTERDTAEILKQYVTTVDPRFLGLTGTPEQIKQAAASFKAYYAKVPTEGGKNYTMDHTAAFNLLDGKGESRVLANNTLGADARSEEHTSELQSLMRTSYAVFCLNKQNDTPNYTIYHHTL